MPLLHVASNYLRICSEDKWVIEGNVGAGTLESLEFGCGSGRARRPALWFCKMVVALNDRLAARSSEVITVDCSTEKPTSVLYML